jgi:hypothetical protein
VAFAQRGGETVPEINNRTLNDTPGFIDNEPTSRVFVEKSQPVSPGVTVDAALAEARDLPLAHQARNARGLALGIGR